MIGATHLKAHRTAASGHDAVIAPHGARRPVRGRRTTRAARLAPGRRS